MTDQGLLFTADVFGLKILNPFNLDLCVNVGHVPGA